VKQRAGGTTKIRILMENAMVMKSELRATMLAACMMLAVVSGSARAQEVPV
jgi:hypothetical protein